MKKLIFFITLFIPISFVNALSYDEVTPIITMESNNTNDVSKTITDKSIIIKVKNKYNNLKYSWTFDNDESIKNYRLNYELNLNSNNKEKIDNLLKKEKTYLSFNHHGYLPIKANISIYLGNIYEDKEELNLYYYNEVENKVELINKNIKVNNGYVDFSIIHCLDYFLTAAVVNNPNKSTDILNYIIIGLSVFAFILGGVVLSKSKDR